MSTKTAQYKQIINFLSNFSIEQQSLGTTVISSPDNTFLIRDIEISSSSSEATQEQLNQIIHTLYQHQNLSCKSILSLIDFDIVFNNTKTQTQIRAVYQYGKKSLIRQIEQRKQTQEQFDQQALWGLLYSITCPLAYLQQKNIIYGVLDPCRVFLDNNLIAVIDPSSTGIDPYEIVDGRLYSPELLQEARCIEDIDMFKSDAYVLGMIMLQCALLKTDFNGYDEGVMAICLNEIRDLYSANLCQLIESLLDPSPENRPSFGDVLGAISNIFQISTSEIATLQPGLPDDENLPNPICELDQYSERENIDILQTEYIRFDENYPQPQRIYHYHRFSNISKSPSELTESMIQEASQYSEASSLCLEDTVQKSFEKSRRIYKAKQIKQKLITQDYAINTQRNMQRNPNQHFNTQKVLINSQRSHKNFSRDHSTSRISDDQNNFQTYSNRKTEVKLNSHIPQSVNYSKRVMKSSKHDPISSQQDLKENKFSENHMKCFSPLNKENLFTKPDIMKMIKSDIKKIQEKKKTGLSVHFSYFSLQENKLPVNTDLTAVDHKHTNTK